MRSLLAILLALSLAACVVGDDPDDTPDDGTDEDASLAFAPGEPAKLNVGFNTGFPDQFAYFPSFFTHAIPAPARLCHAYFSWSVGNQAPHTGVVTDQASRAFVDNWLAKAQGSCDEALISFKSITPGAPPSTSAYAAAFEKFAATDWAAEAGFTGKLSFTPWNEPNNKEPPGNGLGVEIDARLAARYYLAAERSCRKHGCKVAAGDFASNGDMWNDFEWNCANDNVVPSQLCANKSSLNPAGKPASYLDRYKNEIVARSKEFGLPTGFRPAYFAYHGWHDTNRYIDAGDHCSSYQTCTVRRLLQSLGGSWGSVKIWNTEDGAGQTSKPDDRAQACAASFLLRLNTISARIQRLYVTRLHGGDGSLYTAIDQPRPAAKVLAERITNYPGSCQ